MGKKKELGNSISHTKISLLVADISIFSLPELIRLIISSEFIGRNKNRMMVIVSVCQTIHNALWGLEDWLLQGSFLYLPPLEGVTYKTMFLLRTNLKLKERKKGNVSICSLPLFEIGKGKRKNLSNKIFLNWHLK